MNRKYKQVSLRLKSWEDVQGWYLECLTPRSDLTDQVWNLVVEALKPVSGVPGFSQNVIVFAEDNPAIRHSATNALLCAGFRLESIRYFGQYLEQFKVTCFIPS